MAGQFVSRGLNSAAVRALALPGPELRSNVEFFDDFSNTVTEQISTMRWLSDAATATAADDRPPGPVDCLATDRPSSLKLMSR